MLKPKPKRQTTTGTIATPAFPETQAAGSTVNRVQPRRSFSTRGCQAFQRSSFRHRPRAGCHTLAAGHHISISGPLQRWDCPRDTNHENNNHEPFAWIGSSHPPLGIGDVPELGRRGRQLDWLRCERWSQFRCGSRRSDNGLGVADSHSWIAAHWDTHKSRFHQSNSIPGHQK